MFNNRPLFRFGGRRRFDELNEHEVLALAISSEEEDGAIYAAYAEKLRPDFPASASVFEAMSAEEDGHRRALIDLYRTRFGDFIVPIRREHVADFIVEGCVVVELKAIAAIGRLEERQLLTYLKVGGFPLGYILNFGAPKMIDGIMRRVNNFPGGTLAVRGNSEGSSE